MPTLQKIFTLDITPEKFIDNCSDVELQELLLLANAKLCRSTPARPATVNSQPLTVPSDCPPPLPAAPPVSNVPKTLRKQQSWPSGDEEQLRQLWPSMSGMEVAKKLGRNYKTLMSHVNMLDLSKRNHKRNKDARQQPEPVPEPEHLTPASPASKPKKKLISVRVDKRTIVQVPKGTDIEKLKTKYANE